MASNVNVTETIIITPSEPTPNHVLRLSALDSKLFARFVTDYMFVYEPRHGADQAAITENVKTALSRALVPYYPLSQLGRRDRPGPVWARARPEARLGPSLAGPGPARGSRPGDSPGVLGEMKDLLKPRRHTSFEVLAGHVWRSWARALGLAPEQRVRVFFGINVRERMRPGLPTGFYGNGVVHVCAEASAGELAGNGLGFAAGLVARAKEGVGEERVREVVESVSSKWEQVEFVGTLILTQWSRLGLEMVDFGLGRPVQVSPVCSGRFCTFLPVHGVENAVKVNLGVPVTALDQYLSFVKNINE
ncbi:alcohol acyltransferase 9-like [Salvia hispanica]|uniref:alcohol acyltransferase 9-like n=1 Tax=Salvia hispanica TaxID=49212 RepID=UPI002009773D|nr:alcohol acyltransferase 9-like [Salvia hispanica]